MRSLISNLTPVRVGRKIGPKSWDTFALVSKLALISYLCNSTDTNHYIVNTKIFIDATIDKKETFTLTINPLYEKCQEYKTPKDITIKLKGSVHYRLTKLRFFHRDEIASILPE